MQTILGAGGAIGMELARFLPEYTDRIRLVSRNPAKVNPDDEVFAADLINEEEVAEAVNGSEVAYFLAGFPYKYRAWKDMWPKAMRNVINACAKHGTKLVFFDNVYMYDAGHLSNMTETTPINPPSKKGQVRKQIAEMLLEADAKGQIQGLIARSADFYGPGIERNALLNETVTNNLAQGKKANWFCSLDKLHSFTYTPDAARGSAILGNTNDAFGEVWHLPTAPDPLTGREWVEKIAAHLNAEAKAQVAPKWLVSAMGLFVPIMKELREMLYQYDRDYVFNSDKFNTRFAFTPVSYEEGIRKMLREDYPQRMQ